MLFFTVNRWLARSVWPLHEEASGLAVVPYVIQIVDELNKTGSTAVSGYYEDVVDNFGGT